MEASRKAGIETTWRCNWNCSHCYYRRNSKLHAKTDFPVEKICKQIDDAKKRGCNHIYFVGCGEPTLHPNFTGILDYCQKVKLPTSIITNGSIGVEKYQRFYALGLDHLHISTHGTDDVLNAIAESPNAYTQQLELKRWLCTEGLPWRSNCTIQKANIDNVIDVAYEAITYGNEHFVFLNFLPHYEWKNRVLENGVHPDVAGPVIMKAADILLNTGINITIRYFPMCKLESKYWKYVVNSRYVLFDPWEWEYGCYDPDINKVWKNWKGISHAIKSPCMICMLWRHCGGWNKESAKAYNGAGIQAVTTIPDEYKDAYKKRGGLHDMNPANSHKGHYGISF